MLSIKFLKFALFQLSFLSLWVFAEEQTGEASNLSVNSSIEPKKPTEIDRSHPSKKIPRSLRNLPYAIYPCDLGYHVARHNYNKLFNVFPKAIFYPQSVDEAQYVLGQLIKHHLSFSIRSGGHCSEPGSLSSDYIFDLSFFNQILPDTNNKTVFIGAGCRLQNVIDALGAINYAIPTGGCPTVAPGGLALGGGSGLLNRMYGLTCDSIKSILLLNAKNELITVDADHYPDLFWALRGAGNGSYGIVLGYTFNMHYIPETTYLALRWNWDPALAAEIIVRWQKWMQKTPNCITTVLSLYNPKETLIFPNSASPVSIYISGLKVGPDPFTEWEEIFGELNPEVFLSQGTYLYNSQYWVEQSSLPYNKFTSRILQTPLTAPTINYIINYFQNLDLNAYPFLSYFSFEVFGGAVATNEPTAFYPREAFGWWAQVFYWDEKELTPLMLEKSKELYNGIPDEVSNHCYANLPDYNLNESYLKAYYGENVSRLVKIKQKYDPKNIFHWKQSIPVKLPSNH